jgi:hypothetical protein
MTVEFRPEPGAPEPGRPDGPAAAPARSRLRLATVGGIAAIAILGGGITAAASAGAPAGGVAVAAATGAPASPSAPTTQPPAHGTTGTPAPPAPAAPKVHQPHLDGTVTSVSGSTVLIKDHEGFTRTIVTSSKTTYQDGLKAALAVGTKIHAEGTVASNGTSLDATVISTDRGPAGGPAGRGPRGPGGPGGHDGRRDGAPTPPVPGGTSVPTPPAGTSAAPSTSAPVPSAPATTK